MHEVFTIFTMVSTLPAPVVCLPTSRDYADRWGRQSKPSGNSIKERTKYRWVYFFNFWFAGTVNFWFLGVHKYMFAVYSITYVRQGNRHARLHLECAHRRDLSSTSEFDIKTAQFTSTYMDGPAAIGCYISTTLIDTTDRTPELLLRNTGVRVDGLNKVKGGTDSKQQK